MSCQSLREMEMDVLINKEKIGHCKALIYGDPEAVEEVCSLLEEREEK